MVDIPLSTHSHINVSGSSFVLESVLIFFFGLRASLSLSSPSAWVRLFFQLVVEVVGTTFLDDMDDSACADADSAAADSIGCPSTASEEPPSLRADGGK